MITQQEVRDLFVYDEETGNLIRNKTIHYNSKKGDVVGVENHGYLEVTISQKKYRVHRLIWLYVYGEFPDQIDHINGNRSDNRIENLRNVTLKENNKNLKLNTRSSTGIMGVSWFKESRKWRVYIKLNSKQVHIGMYADFFEACCARKSAERKYGFHLNHGRHS